jgi:hypothetical protein
MSPIKVDDQYPFEFETVQVDARGQVIEPKQGRAFAFREPLVDEIGLEMVAIPGGKFIMGSPDSEHDRYEDESPQHPVTIQPFFMGKYPITEAQWQAISNTLPVERELDLNSYGFEEDNLPIEDVRWDEAINLPITGVYWDEAIEFCQRLSREFDRLFQRWSEAIYDHLEKAKRTAVSGQEVEIRKMVDRLIDHCESKERSRLRVMLPAMGLLVSAIAFGILAGLSVPVWLAGGYVPGKPRLLTVAEVENFRWVKSRNGKLARNIFTWNSDSLSNFNCTNSSDQRAVVAREKGQTVARRSDYCLLRVKPP